MMNSGTEPGWSVGRVEQSDDGSDERERERGMERVRGAVIQ